MDSVVVESDYYTILKIKPDASPEEIKASYRRLALQYHPDRTQDPQATPRMQLLNEAFAVLGDPIRRSEYDQSCDLEKTKPLSPVPVDKKPGAVEPEPARKVYVDPQRAVKARRWFRGQLKYLVGLIFLTLLLFAGSLFTGQVSIGAVLLLVLLAVQVIASMVVRMRGTATFQRSGED